VINCVRSCRRSTNSQSIREQLNSISLAQTSRFDSLDSRLQQTITSLLDQRNSNAEDLRDQTLAVAQLLNRTETVISKQHEITRATIIHAVHKYGRRDALDDDSNGIEEPEESLETSMRTDQLKLKFAVEASILESLCFSTISNRYEEVAEAHQSTFKWLFRDCISDGDVQRWDSFSDWLRSGDAIYWINGKAGSGKSTLMRYIYDHPLTKEGLNFRAGPTRLTVAGFFFWNSGTSDQRSQLGLLRALLFRILKQHPDLIPVILPWLWAKRYSQSLNPFDHHEQESLPLSRLMEAFRLLLKQDMVEMKLCLFIDGLDEYDGDHSTIAQLFVQIAESPNVKVCLSSRPLLEFDDCFSSFPGLRLQDLTVEDIRKYVNDNLKSSQRYQALSLQEPIEAPALVEEIVSKADGVFLWVKLVVKSLLSGLGKHDDISDLQHRLLLLPSDLEKLYGLMLNRIDPIYMVRASTIFQIIRESQHTDDTVTILTFALANDPNIRDMLLSTQLWNEPKQIAYCKEMEDRMKAQSAGLLEISGFHRYGLGGEEARRKVQYIHRTFRDYLEKPAVWNLMVGHTTDPEFHPCLALLRACVLQLKIIQHPTRKAGRSLPNLSSRQNCGYTALRYASRVEYRSSCDYCPIVAELDKMWHRFSSEPFMNLVITHNLVQYVNFKLASNTYSLKNPNQNDLLLLALNGRTVCGYSIEYQASSEMLEVLFKHGANSEAVPNHSSGAEMTAWEMVLQSTLQARYDKNRPDFRDFLVMQFPIIKVFLQYGAKPNTLILFSEREIYLTYGRRGFSAAKIIKLALESYRPPDAEEILSLLDGKGFSSDKKSKSPLLEKFRKWKSRNSIFRSLRGEL
jgi:hypothetical protein